MLPLSLVLNGCVTHRASLQHLDFDGNGVISRGEFTDGVADVSFATYDRNRDGFIELAEWQAVEKGAANDGLFRLRDLSRNGRISPQESRLAAEKNGSLLSLFASIDTNRDGFIDGAEARQYRATRR
ncbi:MAG: hypothetical protein WCF18_18170 [Chthoniobacteraceae bacterium]